MADNTVGEFQTTFFWLGDKKDMPVATIPTTGRFAKNTKEFTNDDPADIAKGAIKYDAGKTAVYQGVIDYFPLALDAVAQISEFGAKKYAWKGWEGVPDGFNRYSNAMMRHIFSECRGEQTDPDSGLLHAAHAAWGALARLEMKIKEHSNASKS